MCKISGKLFKNVTGENSDMYMEAVRFEENLLKISLNNDTIANKNKTLNSDYATPEEKAAAQAVIKKLEADNAKFEADNAKFAPSHKTLIDAVAVAGNAYVKNNVEAFRNVLRLCAAVGNSKMTKKALAYNNINLCAIYGIFEKCHSVAGCNGETVVANHMAQQALSKQVKSEIEKALKALFFVPVETEYTHKLSIKFNSGDINALHEAYVTAINIDVTKDKKTGKVKSVDGYSFTTAIKEKRDRDGNVQYEGVRFVDNIAKIAMCKLFA